MNKEEIFAFLRSHPIFQMATVDGDNPRVRTLALHRVDDNGLVFHTHTSKDLHQQLSRNPRVELCFSRAQPAEEIRVSGSVEILEDDTLRASIDAENQDTVVLYILRKGQATFWTRENEFKPKTFIPL